MKLSCEVETLCRIPNLIGECPTWHPGEKAVYWNDTRGSTLHRRSSDGEIKTWNLPNKIGSFAFRRRGGLVAAMQNGFCTIDLPDGTVTPIIDPEPDRPDNRMNDGRCDLRGRFWCGTRDPTDHNPGGSLYRLDPDFSVHTMDTGFICSNGLAFSPDGRSMVFADSYGEGAYIYDLDLEQGAIANKRLFHGTNGVPWLIDGATFDSAGYYWCALVFDWSIGRFDPSGRLDRIVRLPVQHPTMCSFGGENLDVMYVTSASIFLTDDEKEKQPEAGALFAIHGLGATGIPEPEFAG